MQIELRITGIIHFGFDFSKPDSLDKALSFIWLCLLLLPFFNDFKLLMYIDFSKSTKCFSQQVLNLAR